MTESIFESKERQQRKLIQLQLWKKMNKHKGKLKRYFWQPRQVDFDTFTGIIFQDGRTKRQIFLLEHHVAKVALCFVRVLCAWQSKEKQRWELREDRWIQDSWCLITERVLAFSVLLATRKVACAFLVSRWTVAAMVEIPPEGGNTRRWRSADAAAHSTMAASGSARRGIAISLWADGAVRFGGRSSAPRRRVCFRAGAATTTRAADRRDASRIRRRSTPFAKVAFSPSETRRWWVHRCAAEVSSAGRPWSRCTCALCNTGLPMWASSIQSSLWHFLHCYDWK